MKTTTKLQIGTVITYDGGRQGEVVDYGPNQTYEVLDYQTMGVFDLPMEDANR